MSGIGESGIGTILFIIFFICALLAGIVIFCTIGVLFGSGMSVVNYSKSFSENVKVEKPLS